MKKTFIHFAAIFLVFSLFIAGCSNNDSNTDAPGSASSKGKVTPGGELKWALAGTVTEDNLDAHKSGNAQNGRVTRSLYDSLVVELPDHTIKPWLATSWEISEDKKSYTFKLREDVTFHDGTPFNAEAVKFNFDRIKDPNTKASNSLNEIGPYESTEVLDEFTVKINFSAPFSPFLSNAAKSDLGFVSPAAVEKYGDKFPQNPVGTGPFKLEKFTPGTQVELVKNEDYNWAPENAAHQGPAYLDKLTIQFVPEEATRVGVLQSKQVHAADIIPPQNLLTLKEDSNFNVLETELRQINFSLYLNPAKTPWNDLKVREAVRSALDIKSAVETVYLGTSEQAWSPITPTMFGYTNTVENSWKPDPKKTAQLLKETGWKKGEDGIWNKDGKPLEIDFIDTQGNREKRMDLMTVFQQQLKQAGIQLNIISLSAGAYSERRENGEYDLVAASQFSGDPDVMRQIFSSEGPLGKQNLARTDVKELNQLLEQGYLESEPDKRKEIYKKAQEYIIKNVYSIPTYLFQYSFATGSEVNGITFDSPSFPVFYDAWIQQ
ncbi:ABC transporter substrate-binding protein [Domibacillus sp. DTU_2020_1001157_1_SI_ALB_TIR_016]|uniref:ABC transporter substrate-binding protein n=1 Tax=Domibacillus sp. DTU_2020_1001157_1_SI_ALB_TIR_016 TaxID=3077789 RepID=UPI0028ECB7A5|nr:ABC transporter substrate-binding protein [Domibacillus sp. DTU_2020_1001157_1_SI_ALB_TIR_016]WNS78347.1 ABC transporter substrate-binding protein [Domibacillus sp. DTU_2020_1001157_1_SI_ALB_TIR_016]